MRSLGAVREAAPSLAVGFVLSLLFVGRAHADEVIVDPELAGSAPAPAPSGTPAAVPSATAPTSSSNASPSTTDARFQWSLHTRWGFDTSRQHDSQDVTEGTTVAVFEAEQRRSETLLLSVGLRARHVFAERRNGTTRYELDIVPTSAFADVTLDDGLHVRAGYQTVSMGRFDVFSATNFLAAYDLRSGPVTMPEASEVGQPAIRFDMDRVSGFLLQTWFLPFFQPDIVTAYGTDYALLAPLDRAIDDMQGQAGVDARNARRALEAAIGRSGLAVASTHAIQALGPAPSLGSPQGAMRATVHGTAGEASLTFGTALERLPAITFSRAFSEALAAGRGIVDAGSLKVAYNRFSVASIDGALDVGPFQLGAEAAFMKNRTLLAAAEPLASGIVPLAVPEQTDLVYGGLRAELVESAGWAAAIEAFITGAPDDPAPPAGGAPARRWMAFEHGRYFRGIAAGVHVAPEESRIRLELGGLVLSGPTYVVLPRFEWEALRRFYLELGAVVVGGPSPTAFGVPNVSLGGLYDDVDQVFVGARWVP